LIDVDALVERAHEKLRQLAAAADLAGLSIERHVRVGVPYHELLDCCRELDGDLLVVGTRARTGLDHLLLGSTAERVLRKARIPVLVAKRPLTAPPSTIAVPTDFSDASRPAVAEAVALARRWGAELSLLHVIEPVAHIYGWAGELAGSEIYFVEPEEIEPEWKAFVAELDLEGVRWEKRTTKGDVVAAIAKSTADLIVMGTHGRSALPHALLGSVAEGVVRNADACVLTVRPDAFTFTLP
jgi:nucleotide-binding universal stress UspA family protein